MSVLYILMYPYIVLPVVTVKHVFHFHNHGSERSVEVVIGLELFTWNG